MDYRLFIYSLFLQLIGFINGLPQTVMIPSLSSPTSSSTTRTSSSLDIPNTTSSLTITRTSRKTNSFPYASPTSNPTETTSSTSVPAAPPPSSASPPITEFPLPAKIAVSMILAGVLTLGIFLLLRIRQRKKAQLQAMAIANGEVAATEKPNGLVSLPTEEVKNTGSATSPADTPTGEVVAEENTIDLGPTVSRRLTL